MQLSLLHYCSTAQEFQEEMYIIKIKENVRRNQSLCFKHLLREHLCALNVTIWQQWGKVLLKSYFKIQLIKNRLKSNFPLIYQMTVAFFGL